ncbi:MAG: peptide chain release factor-like protein [Deltaproteobacteria bacterium]|nr:peptide chain release factor-like protein [Deltaproteobacteria bacterium]
MPSDRKAAVPPFPPPPAPPKPDPHALAAASARLSDEDLAAECDLEFFTAGGPGGQHRNKTESGVRLRHRPTGFVAAATERRSQLQNRGAAIERLRAKLVAAAFVPKKRKKTRPSASSKRRRLDAKRRQGDRKRERRDFD